MNTIKDMTNKQFTEYLQFLADDFAEQGMENTTADILEAIRRINQLTKEKIQ